MDPLTAALNTTTAIITFAEKIFDAMPDDVKKANAGDFGKIAHNCSAFIAALQDRINAAVAPASH